MNFFHKLLLMLIISSITTFGSAHQPDYYIIPQGAEVDVAQARQAFECFYRDLVLNGHFDLSYNNNLIINTVLNGDAQREGVIMLTLLNWLTHRKDRDSKFLLKQLNHLYFLELHNLLSNLDGDKNTTARMLQLCDQLHNFTTTNPITHQIKKPFNTSLSRLFIVITTNNSNDISYENRKKSMALALERIGKKMLHINKRLGDLKISDQKITSFISLLSAHAAVEPMVKTSIVKNVVIASILIALISYIAYDYFFRDKSLLSWLDTWVEKRQDTTLKNIGKGIASGLISGILTEETNKKGTPAIGTQTTTTAPPVPPATSINPVVTPTINPAVRTLLDNTHQHIDAIVDHTQQRVEAMVDHARQRADVLVDHAQQRLDVWADNALNNLQTRAYNIKVIGHFFPPTAAQEQQYQRAINQGDFFCGAWMPWNWNWANGRWMPWVWCRRR